MKVKPRGIEIPLIIVLVVLSIFVLGTLGLIIMRLGKTGVFSQQAAYTEEVTTRAEDDEVITTKRVTTTAAEVTTTEKAAETEKETEKETETTEKKAETTTVVTTTETKPEETKAPETKASEAKTEKSDTTKKTDTTKKEEKTEKTTTTAKESDEKDPFALYKKYVNDELVPKYGLAAAGEEKRALDNKGIASVMIRDFSNSGDQEMLLIRIEPSNQYYAAYPIFELYGIKDGKVEMLNSVACNDSMSMGDDWGFHLTSEWNIRNDGNSVYLWAKQADVGGAEENLRISEIALSLANHKVQAVKASTTTGDPNGPEKSFSVEAFWVCEVINRLSEDNRGNEGRVYKMNDYTGLRDWIK